MANRSRGRVPVVRAKRSPTNWSRLVGVQDVVIAAGTKVLLATVNLSNPGIGETVRRTRGSFLITSDQVALLEVQTGALGMMVVSDVAAAAGIASIPGPVTEAEDDGWFVWVPFHNLSSATGGSGSVGNSPPGFRFEFDSKAMRKVEEGFRVAVVIENASPTNGLTITHAFSMLTSLS